MSCDRLKGFRLKVLESRTPTFDFRSSAFRTFRLNPFSLNPSLFRW